MDVFHYGVFTLGQIWTLADQDGARLGFRSRELALAALQTVVAVHRAAGDSIAVTIQDETGRLRTMLNPVDDLTTTLIANDVEWDVMLSTRTQPAAARPSAANLDGG
jgi:hypothetical protein